MGKSRVLTAAEARQITETSTYMLNKVYKWIEEAAKENFCLIPFSTDGLDTNVVAAIFNELKNNGYTIVPSNNLYNISW